MKTANNKIPVSSVYNDSEGLYGTTVYRCLVGRPHYSAWLMLYGSRGASEFATENALTEIAWEGLGMAMSNIASEKNMELLFIGYIVYKQ